MCRDQEHTQHDGHIYPSRKASTSLVNTEIKDHLKIKIEPIREKGEDHFLQTEVF
jgi:hypothetical protein